MGILDALRVQKAGQKSIQELSQLPQQEIMQMAQMGQIPADVVPVVISEKARLAQQAAQAQALQSQRPPSVMDQAMQVNAQHEQQGLPAIPTQGMFQEQNYQAGGIVGYAGDGEEGQVVDANGGLAKYVQQARNQLTAINANPMPLSKAETDLAAMLKAPPADENKMMWMSLLRGGLKALGGSSPYANVNLGQGLGEAAQAYEEGLKEQQKTKLAYAKEMADQARAQRQEGLPALTIGAKLHEAEMASKAALEKAIASGSMNSYVRFQVEAAQEAGDPRSIKAIAAEAATQYAKIMAALEPRTAAAAAQGTSAQAATKQAVTAETKAGTDADIRRDELIRKESEARQAAVNKALEMFKDEWAAGTKGIDRDLAKRIREARKSGEASGGKEGGDAAVDALKNRLKQQALSGIELPKVTPPVPQSPAAQSSPTGLFSPKVNRTVTQSEIDATAKKYGISAQQVKAQLGIQ